jgi:lysophosphatidylcholine acyltransferase/lyso-PAF acetyltransferase
MRGCARLNLFLLGYIWIEYEKDTKIDYREYLGPDWKAQWDGAPTYIGNHCSWLDIMYAIDIFFPGFVARSSVRDTWGVGPLSEMLGSVYINRVGEGSRDSKIGIFKAINDRQQDFMAGKTTKKFFIFPEGSTTNGDYLISFKKGAFSSLLPVQPVTAKCHSHVI